MLKRLRRDQGQDLVEYALVFPILAALLFGIVEMVLVFYAYNTIAEAARDGARYAVVHPLATTAEIRNAAITLAKGLNQADLTVTPSPLAGNAIRVVVTYKARFITALISQAFGGQPYLLLQAASTMQRE